MEPALPDLNRALLIDAAAETERLSCTIREMVFKRLKRKGAVVGVSGGIDSSVVASLCVRALGSERVVALFTPDTDSSPDSLRLGRLVADALGIRSFLEDISAILHSARCYERRDDAIRSVIPEYGQGYKSKIALPDLLEGDRYAIFSVLVQ